MLLRRDHESRSATRSATRAAARARIARLRAIPSAAVAAEPDSPGWVPGPPAAVRRDPVVAGISAGARAGAPARGAGPDAWLLDSMSGPGATDPDRAERAAMEADTAEIAAVELDAAEPAADGPDSLGFESPGSDVITSDLTEPELFEPDVIEPDVMVPGPLGSRTRFQRASAGRTGADRPAAREPAVDRAHGRRVGSAWAAIRRAEPARETTDLSDVVATSVRDAVPVAVGSRDGVRLGHGHGRALRGRPASIGVGDPSRLLGGTAPPSAARAVPTSPDDPGREDEPDQAVASDPGGSRFRVPPDDVGGVAEPGQAGERGRGWPHLRLPGRRVRLDPGRPGAVALLVTAAVSALATAVVTWLASPSVEPADQNLTPAARSLPASAAPAAGVGGSGSVAAGSASTIVVSVVGAVPRPGLLTLPAGSRVADALAAAGGALPGVDTTTLNLARRLSDGEQVAVGVPAADQPAAAGGAVAETGAGGVVNLNLATVGELDTLPGVGPVIAQRIVDYRDANGPFQSVDQLAEVSGIGTATLEKLRERVTV